jgi:hypothetical protein
MRYYLAIKAYLECVAGEPAGWEDMEAIASRWFDMTTRFPLQLFEVSRADYLRNKTKELRQQRELQSKGS